MKNIIILFTTFFLYNSCLSQNKSGLIIYEIKYPNGRPLESRLYFNDSISLHTRLSTKFHKHNDAGVKQEGEGIAITFKYGDEKGEIIHRNFNTEKIKLRYPKSEAYDEFTVDDNWIKIAWEIQEDTLTIGNFKCKKAIGDFRGRTYIAWFAEEIPLPYGPFKLFGLPGLILQAEDTEKMFSVFMKRIEYPTNQEFEVDEPNEKNKKTLIEYAYLWDNFTDLLIERLNSKMSRGVYFKNDSNKKDTKRDKLIEKKFEWEN
jgi:GLPGLI family protein